MTRIVVVVVVVVVVYLYSASRSASNASRIPCESVKNDGCSKLT